MNNRFKVGDRVECNGNKGRVTATYYLNHSDKIGVRWDTPPNDIIHESKLKKIQPAVSEVIQVGDIVHFKDGNSSYVGEENSLLNKNSYWASRVEKIVRPTATEVVWSADDSQAE